jgi:5-methyltetrahydropteroyltriglutamate--homocysteine methyltransferase
MSASTTATLFPTTIAGSLPKPSWLAAPNLLWAPWRLEGEELKTAKDDATLLALKLQEDAGIDIVADGEQARQHFVHGFLEAVEGIDFERRVEMGIRNNRYKAMCPTVVGSAATAFARARARSAAYSRPHQAKTQIHPARPDDHCRHHRRRPLRRPRRDGDGFRRAAQ